MPYFSKERYRNWIPHGFSFLNSDHTQKRIKLEQKIREIFCQNGYEEVSPPSFDYKSTFQIASRQAEQESLFPVWSETQKEQLAIRSDLTVQVVKATANGMLRLPSTRQNKDQPLRFFYIQPVFQDHSWGSGRKRETLQAGIELLNSPNPKERIKEVLSIAKQCVSLMSYTKPRILYGDVRVLEQLLYKLPERERSQFSIAFYKKDTTLIESICRQMEVEGKLTEILSKIPLMFGNAEVIDELCNLCKPYPKLCTLFQEAKSFEDVIFDFTLVRELSYYTGPVFEAYIPGINKKIFTGGVYDDLYSEFSQSKACMNACGFAINLSMMIEQS